MSNFFIVTAPPNLLYHSNSGFYTMPEVQSQLLTSLGNPTLVFHVHENTSDVSLLLFAFSVVEIAHVCLIFPASNIWGALIVTYICSTFLPSDFTSVWYNPIKTHPSHLLGLLHRFPLKSLWKTENFQFLFIFHLFLIFIFRYFFFSLSI